MRIRVGIYTLFSMACAVGLPVSAHAQLSIDTHNPLDWKISNGSLTLDWNSKTGNVFGVVLAGHTDNLVDTTHLGAYGQPSGLYMDNDGTNLGSGTTTAAYHQGGTSYLDWWVTTASNATNAFTYTKHFLLRPNDPTLHVYFVVDHSATDIAGDLGQVQYVFRLSQTLFNHTYSYNSGLHNQGPTAITLPSPAVLGNTDPGRQVQNAVVDLTGLTLPATFARQFYTKYDYASYEYQHQAHGVYGSTYGAWTVIPRSETLVGGPTKQDLIFTDNILMMECLSGHDIGGDMAFTPAQGVDTRRLFGPYAFHFNAFTTAEATPAALYADAVGIIPSATAFYDADPVLTSYNGYVASKNRSTVQAAIAGGGSATANTAWTVLSDNATNFQASANGLQYWQAQNATGSAAISGVAPGTYRLSSYVLGQWGELRVDDVKVPTGGKLNLTGLTFTPENFATAPVWTIGTPDRSAWKFKHGNVNGIEQRDYYGSFNYWQDYASTQGAQIYYATAVGSVAATNNLSAINYVLWGQFDPGLFAGVYHAGDDSADGYDYAIPSYVAGLSGAAGTNGVLTPVPPLTVHFTTTNAQLSGASYAVLSVGLAAAEGSLTVSLNGHPLTWHAINTNDAMVRSGLSGYYQWIAYQWDVSDLKAAGGDNVLTFTTSHADGDMFDALRFELAGKSADPAVTGWHDYEYLYGSTYTPANEAVPNN